MGGGPVSIFNASNAERNGPTLVASIGRNQQRKPSERSSIDAMEQGVHDQVDDLPAFARDLGRYHEFQHVDPSCMVFTGSGDSFASSLFAHYLSEGEAIAADPYELQLYPKVTKNKIVFIISVSGKTKANIQLAKGVKRLAEKRVAITAKPESPLARECDDVIQLRYRDTGILTSGTGSFSASLLAVASVIGQLPTLRSLRIMERRAAEWARPLWILPHGGFLFVMYAAFKVHEVLGLSAQYQHTEQLGHSQLFSLRKKSDNIVCVALGSDKKTNEVFRVLSKDAFHAYLLKSRTRDPVLSSLHAVFCLQHLALNTGRKMGLQECGVLTDKKRLALSSRLIY
jgi:hypothetical protein